MQAFDEAVRGMALGDISRIKVSAVCARLRLTRSFPSMLIAL
jgi:hypothetical protein